MKRLLSLSWVALAALATLAPSHAAAQIDPPASAQAMVRGSFADGPSGPAGLSVLSLFAQLADERLATPQAGADVALAGALDTLGAVGQSNAAAGCTGTTGSAASTGCATFQAGSGFAVAAVPEPGVLLLLGASLLGLGATRFRRAKR